MSSYGLLGGLGEGLQNYSLVLGEKRREDWANKKAELQYKRERELERLRAENRRNLAKQQRGWQEEDLNKRREWNLEDRDTKREWQIQDKNTQREWNLQDKEAAREDYVWKLGETSKAAVDTKKAMWDELEKSGAFDNYNKNQQSAMKAAYIFGIQLPKGTKVKPPTDRMWEIAQEVVSTSAPEDADPRDLLSSIKTVAWGLAQDPDTTLSSIKNGSLIEDEVDLPRLIELAKRSSQGNSGAKKDYDILTQKIKDGLGLDGYNQVMDIVNKAVRSSINAPPKDSKESGRGLLGSIKNYSQRDWLQKEFEKEVDTTYMTDMAKKLAYDKWLKAKGR
jgi:hypothetical protein